MHIQRCTGLLRQQKKKSLCGAKRNVLCAPATGQRIHTVGGGEIIDSKLFSVQNMTTTDKITQNGDTVSIVTDAESSNYGDRWIMPCYHGILSSAISLMDQKRQRTNLRVKAEN